MFFGDNVESILEVKNIQKSFGEKVLHESISFSLFKGECLGVLGGSGTGKSTLLRCLIGLEDIDSGKIIFDSQEIQSLTEKEWMKVRLKISYSFQNGALFDSFNVFENIAYPLFEHTHLKLLQIQEKVRDMLKLVDLSGIEQLMPSDLSGGMQKRVGMARSMIMSPPIILFDEPTAGLDPTNTKNVVSIMKKLKQLGQSSIFVTHDIPSALDICDRIIILANRQITFLGTPRDFLESENEEVLKYKQEQNFTG